MANSRARSRNIDSDTTGDRITGHATAAGTKRFTERFSRKRSSTFYRSFANDVTVASLGMGTYLGDCDDAKDARYVTVLTTGSERGLNVVDTAINYRCQRSERAVGRALRQVIDQGIATRDELVVSTKGGYIPLDGSPPPSRELYDAFLDAQYFGRGVMTRADVVS